MPKLLNKRRLGRHSIENATFIGRPSPWGNPFVMNDRLTRDGACDLFERYAQWRMASEPGWLAPLRGKDLVCYCAPQRCHGETLLRLANAMEVA